MCVYVFVCQSYTCMVVHGNVYGGYYWSCYCFPFCSLLYLGGRGQNPSLNLELSLTLTNLVIQLVLGIPILSLLSARIVGTCHTCLAFVWVLDIQIVVLMFSWQALYSLSMYPNPLVLPDCGRHYVRSSLKGSSCWWVTRVARGRYTEKWWLTRQATVEPSAGMTQPSETAILSLDRWPRASSGVQRDLGEVPNSGCESSEAHGIMGVEGWTLEFGRPGVGWDLESDHNRFLHTTESKSRWINKGRKLHINCCSSHLR